ncbi:unnamed protein product [Paramecium octaurelia]|uniref:Uncharacterized protein n=1 Tax=Paramecium octaurelia TaxID=43137 RepID=A0A8S1S4K5_PAROT|nr:unnamed protein product [Paramecium octaurelia]
MKQALKAKLEQQKAMFRKSQNLIEMGFNLFLVLRNFTKMERIQEACLLYIIHFQEYVRIMKLRQLQKNTSNMKINFLQKNKAQKRRTSSMQWEAEQKIWNQPIYLTESYFLKTLSLQKNKFLSIISPIYQMMHSTIWEGATIIISISFVAKEELQINQVEQLIKFLMLGIHLRMDNGINQMRKLRNDMMAVLQQ